MIPSAKLERIRVGVRNGDIATRRKKRFVAEAMVEVGSGGTFSLWWVLIMIMKWGVNSTGR